MSATEPPTGLTPFGEAVAQVHEMFLSFLAAGFTEYQACMILGSFLASTGQGYRTSDE
jgi:hypothetical protein